MKRLLGRINIRVRLLRTAYYLCLTLFLYTTAGVFEHAYRMRIDITIWQVLGVASFGAVVLALRHIAKHLDMSIYIWWED